MTATPVRRLAVTEPEPLKTVVLSSSAEILSLKHLVRRSKAYDDIMFDPEFFVRSISSEWIPSAVAVFDRSDLAGLIYAKERKLLGRRLGILYADLSLGSILFGDAARQEEVFRLALETLLDRPGTRGVRLRVLRGGPEWAAVRKIISSRQLDVHFMRVKEHANLPLPSSYEQFLKSLGSTTRHNFRYYRRRFESAGHTYLDYLTPNELRAASLYLRPKCSIPSRLGAIERILDMVDVADRPLAVGLKHRNGEWLGVVGGVYRSNAGVLYMQLNNDTDFAKDSLSVVLRAYLIETLIRQGMKVFTIWAGTSSPLSRYVNYIPTLGVHLDLPSYQWRVARRIISAFGSLLPEQVKTDARWIAPFPNRYLAG